MTHRVPADRGKETFGWSELRIVLGRSAQDEVLLDEVLPWLQEHRRVEADHGVFYIRERKGGQEMLRVWGRGSYSPATAQLADRILESGKVPAAAIEVIGDSELEFADGTYTGARASTLISGLLSEVTPLLLEQLARVAGDSAQRNEVALEMMVAHLAAADFYSAWPDRYPASLQDGEWPRIFVVFRSHADGFIIMTKDPKTTLAALDQQYAKMSDRLPRRIAHLLSNRTPSDGDESVGACWYRIARRYLLLADEALRQGDLAIRWDEGYLGDTHDLSMSPFHQAFQQNQELRSFQRTDRGFQAMRFTMSALYLVLSNLGIRLIDRYFLCHAISRACQEIYEVDPAELVLSQVSTMRSLESAV